MIAFNGEIYNHTELRVAGRSHCACVARPLPIPRLCWPVYRRGVLKNVDQRRGNVAIALWDRELRTLSWPATAWARNLYYGWQGDTFLFGSELKALKAHPAFRGDIDRGALALLLRHNYVPALGRFTRHSQSFRLARFLQISLERRDANPVPYWSLAEVAERRGQSVRWFRCRSSGGVELHLGAAVRGQMVADVPLGALLSGGIDSTAIAALMQSQSTKPVRTFTIGFGEREYDEASHARAVAAHLGTDHTELRLNGGDALALVPDARNV